MVRFREYNKKPQSAYARIGAFDFVGADLCVCPESADRFFASFVRPDSNHVLDRRDKNFPVADLSSLRRFEDRFHYPRRHFVGCQDFDLHFWKEIYGVLGSTVKLRM